MSPLAIGDIYNTEVEQFEGEETPFSLSLSTLTVYRYCFVKHQVYNTRSRSHQLVLNPDDRPLNRNAIPEKRPDLVPRTA